MYLACIGLLPVSIVLHRDKATIQKQMLVALHAFSGSERMPYETMLEIGRYVDRDSFLREIGKQVPTEDANTQSGQRSQTATTRWSARDIRLLSSSELDTLLQRTATERSKNEWVVASFNQFGYYSSSGLRFGGPSIHSDGALEDLVSSEFEAPLLYLMSIGQALQTFGTSIRYLGPLRDEPKVVHGVWDERVDSLPVGIRGELTAEVLTRRKSDYIQYRDWNNRPAKKSLPDAVADWCNYLGLGDHINVLDLGKQGRGIELRVNGVHRDLTTIGVGASQLLPVLVAGLTVPIGSIVMVEQPELHLHPKVQSRLADFFLYARPGVKFLIETHSEYLITRIRRRVAEGKVSPTTVRVMFAEQHQGATSVRTLGMSEFGDFEVWPDGFFDAQDDDSLEIVRAVALRLGGND
ncbi:hypothetical protein C9424_20510 [Arthrobacter sp. H-02-3]|nr:hypothetical protein C9424_20510 [Arthrobacter sp. H-02-3]